MGKFLFFNNKINKMSSLKWVMSNSKLLIYMKIRILLKLKVCNI